jgi:hypothetical protein
MPSGHCSALLHFFRETLTMTFRLNQTEVLADLKLSLKGAQKAFNEYPNAMAWNLQQRHAFVYQQAFYFFSSIARSDEQKTELLQALTNDKDHNWGDLICEACLNMKLAPALKEYAL